MRSASRFVPQSPKVIRWIDHLVAVVEEFDAARRVWLEAGCPVVWDGRIRGHRSCCFSIGPINLEMNAREVFEGWPALATWSDWTSRRFGLHAVAFDPGRLDAAVSQLRAGLAMTEPREGALTPSEDAPAARPPRWRNSLAGGLPGLLPGLPSFLCEFVAPGPGQGRIAPESPIRFVEICVGVPEPAAAAASYQRVLGVGPQTGPGGILIPLGDTPLRLVEGDDWFAVLKPRRPGLSLDDLAAAVPGLGWV